MAQPLTSNQHHAEAALSSSNVSVLEKLHASKTYETAFFGVSWSPELTLKLLLEKEMSLAQFSWNVTKEIERTRDQCKDSVKLSILALLCVL